MIFNDENINIEKAEACYIIRKHSKDTYIKLYSEDEKSIVFSFCDNEFDPRNLEMNKKTDINKLIYWDISLKTKDTYYLFDISKDKVELTRIDDNLFELEVDVENPNMIYSPINENATFKNLIIKTNISFTYNE